MYQVSAVYNNPYHEAFCQNSVTVTNVPTLIPFELSGYATDGFIRVHWEHPVGSGGSEGPIYIGCRVYRNGMMRTNTIIPPSTNSFDDDDVEEGVEYEYYVTAVYVYLSRNTMVESLGSNLVTLSLADVSEKEEVSGVYKTELMSNYPNPFNPETRIVFAVGTQRATEKTQRSTERIEIIIFNSKGQKVRSLVDGNYGAGVHIVTWNGLDDKGQRVSSGIYFYRMRTEGYVSVKKMLLLK
jgi:hypothetical protein